MGVTVLGIRHHGPGSARGVAAALGELAPDCVLIEGPPEGDAVAGLAASPDLEPPVALLVYATAAPARAASWPFAVFSPEWQALRHAVSAAVPARFVDLPVAQWFALEDRARGRGPAADEPAPDDPAADDPAQGEAVPDDAAPGDAAPGEAPPRPGRRHDPLRLLAEAAGHGDPERWWEDVVEQRRDAAAPFAAIAEAMGALREQLDADGDTVGERQLEQRREAAMRRGIRAAVRDGHERIAVVCGAWHVPALERLPTQAHDTALLKGLGKVAVTATWVPWSHGRLAASTGYGAGVTSPGWYAHLFDHDADVVTRWVVRAARLLRGEDLDASSAAVVDAVRAAETLAALRDRPLAGLPELDDAIRAVLCAGSDVPMALVRERLVIGEALGAVPDETPQVPLAADLARERKRLRLRQSAAVTTQELDLRRPLDRDRSRLLHRLDLLGVPWGRTDGEARGTGTFREEWALCWRPELAVRVIEAASWGTTVSAAADARTRHAARTATDLAALTALVGRTLTADLPGALGEVMDAVSRRAAVDSDVGRLADALPALARVQRYGDVRGTTATAVAAVVEGLVARIAVGLPGAVHGLDDDAAALAVRRIDGVADAVGLLDDEGHRARWHDALHRVADRSGVHGLVGGRACRLLADAGALDPAEVRRRASRALSVGVEPARGAAWAEGFLAGGGVVLLHDDELLGLVDGWIAGIPADRFAEALPLLRRTFATFPVGERRRIAAAAAAREQGGPTTVGAPGAAAADDVDPERGARVRGVLERLLGVPT